MRVSDLLQRGEGLLPHTYFSYALIKRMTGAQKYIHYVPVDLSAALSGGEDNSADVLLQQLDEVQIFNQDELRDLPHVTVIGEVRNPGDYPLTEQMRLSDLIYQAGGLKDDANRNNAELARTEVGPDSKTLHTYMSIDLVPVIVGDTSRDILLKNNDQVFIKIATNWHLPESVQLAGRVARPGPYVIRPGEQLSSVLLRCGGLMPDAFPQGIVLIRQSVQQLEQQRLDQARSRLSQELAQYSLTLSVAATSNSNNSGGMTTATAGMATLQQLLATASTEQADGRVVVHFNSLEQLAGSADDVVLDDQDSITIPKRPSSVAVLGQVNNPTAIVARPNFTVADYLYKAGGATTNGDMDGLMVIKADGSVLTEEGIKHGPRESLFPLLPLVSGGIMGRTLSAGDTIYVPDNLADIPKYLSLTEKKDIAQIIASAAQGAAVVGILASQL
jgi:polysaccharide biosynthesis/export protein